MHQDRGNSGVRPAAQPDRPGEALVPGVAEVRVHLGDGPLQLHLLERRQLGEDVLGLQRLRVGLQLGRRVTWWASRRPRTAARTMPVQ